MIGVEVGTSAPRDEIADAPYHGDKAAPRS